MRLLGAALVAAAGLWCGLLAAGGLRRAEERCGGLCRLLELLRCELTRFCTPLPELFETAAAALDGAAGTAARSVAESLRRGERFAAAWTAATAALPGPEGDILRPLGSVLGRYGAAEQAAALENARMRMEALRDERRRARREKGRLYVGLSAGAGLLLAVCLI